MLVTLWIIHLSLLLLSTTEGQIFHIPVHPFKLSLNPLRYLFHDIIASNGNLYIITVPLEDTEDGKMTLNTKTRADSVDLYGLIDTLEHNLFFNIKLNSETNLRISPHYDLPYLQQSQAESCPLRHKECTLIGIFTHPQLTEVLQSRTSINITATFHEISHSFHIPLTTAASVKHMHNHHLLHHQNNPTISRLELSTRNRSLRADVTLPKVALSTMFQQESVQQIWSFINYYARVLKVQSFLLYFNGNLGQSAHGRNVFHGLQAAMAGRDNNDVDLGKLVIYFIEWDFPYWASDRVNRHYAQTTAMAAAMYHTKHSQAPVHAPWLAYFDLDEFIMFPSNKPHRTLPQLLSTLGSKLPLNVAFQMRLAHWITGINGSNPNSMKYDTLCTSLFTYDIYGGRGNYKRGKYIANTAVAGSSLNVHRIENSMFESDYKTVYVNDVFLHFKHFTSMSPKRHKESYREEVNRWYRSSPMRLSCEDHDSLPLNNLDAIDTLDVVEENSSSQQSGSGSSSNDDESTWGFLWMRWIWSHVLQLLGYLHWRLFSH